MHKEKFDGLAYNYDLYRPRYPEIFFKEINNWCKKSKERKNNINIIDIGSGTGIALEGLVKKFGTKNNFYAIDLSKDMIHIGNKKFPYVSWIQGKAEKKIPLLPSMDVAVIAQSFQWMDRIPLLKLIKKKLNKHGIICILQNNRQYKNNFFLDKYESLLEEFNPHYSRHYREFNYEQELKLIFPKSIYIYIYITWKKLLNREEFIGLSNSSTQVKKAQNINSILFQEKINQLIDKYILNQKIKINFASELFIIKK